jgi:predicted small metal-binding protein
MARKYIDCRESPDLSKGCSVAISADSEEEVIEAAAMHGVDVHGYQDTPELREHLRAAIKEGSPRP